MRDIGSVGATGKQPLVPAVKTSDGSPAVGPLDTTRRVLPAVVTHGDIRAVRSRQAPHRIFLMTHYMECAAVHVRAGKAVRETREDERDTADGAGCRWPDPGTTIRGPTT